MKRICIFLLSTLLIMMSITYSSCINNLNKGSNFIEQYTHYTIEKFNLLNIFSNPKVTINSQTINIELDMDGNFSKFDTINQYIHFTTLVKRLLFILNSHHKDDSISRKEIIITGQSGKNSFKYICELPYKNLSYFIESNLSINNKIVLSSSEFKRIVKEHNLVPEIEKVNGYDDLDILIYGRRIFNLITNNRKYYTPEKDDKLVLDAVCDKYNITVDEYLKIDNKYYLFMSPY